MVTGFENSLCLDVAAIVMIPAWLMLLLSFFIRKVRWPLRLPAISEIGGYLIGYVDLQNRPVVLEMTNLGARNAFEGLRRLIGPLILGEILGTVLMIFGFVAVAVLHRASSAQSQASTSCPPRTSTERRSQAMTSFDDRPPKPALSEADTPGRFLRETRISSATFAGFGALCSLLMALLFPPMNTLALGMGAVIAGTAGVVAWWFVCGGPRRYSIVRSVGAGVVASLLCNPVLPIAVIVVQTRSFPLDIVIPYAMMYFVVGWFTIPTAITAALVCRRLVLGRPAGPGKVIDASSGFDRDP